MRDQPGHFDVLRALFEKKAKMRERGLPAAKGNCPWCGAKGQLVLVLAGRKEHLHASCAACGRGMME